MNRYLALSFGVLAYVSFLFVFMYWFGFVINVGVPKGIDSPAQGHWLEASVVNAILITIFGLQHSIMARPAFKRILMRYIPAVIERSFYVMASNIALALLFWLWRPIGGTVWQIEDPLISAMLYGLFGLGFLIILCSSFLINHFDLFGLRQIWFYMRGKAYEPLPFAVPFFYRYVRHPLYVGWLLSLWATPHMTIAHLLFAVGFSAYILIAIPFEERDLVAHHGAAYAQYRLQVPKLLPRVPRTSQVWRGNNVERAL